MQLQAEGGGREEMKNGLAQPRDEGVFVALFSFPVEKTQGCVCVCVCAHLSQQITSCSFPFIVHIPSL